MARRRNPAPNSTENTVPKQLTPFRPGQSGNPNGRPKGSRNAATVAIQSLLDGQAQALTQKAVDLALSGDLVALRICLDRILPPRKDRPIEFAMPVISTIADAPKAMAAITTAVAQVRLRRLRPLMFRDLWKRTCVRSRQTTSRNG
jgi:hypothetical protein